jgi:hypothetical protein
LKVLDPPVPNGVFIGNGLFAIENGQYDMDTGTLTCNEGFEPNDDSTACVEAGLSGGEVFGVILLVVVLLCLTGIIVWLVYWRVKHPAKLAMLAAKIKART